MYIYIYIYIYIIFTHIVHIWSYTVLKPLGGPKVGSAFHPSKVDKMSTRNC